MLESETDSQGQNFVGQLVQILSGLIEKTLHSAEAVKERRHCDLLSQACAQS
jgi:hypothetical protein